MEAGEPSASPGERGSAFRHTIAFKQTGRVVGFAQNVSPPGRALWPCPGLGTMHGERALHASAESTHGELAESTEGRDGK
jgi:hypothetical protein